MNVNLYTTSTCPFSQQEKVFLQEKGVLFTEIVLDKTPEKLPQFSAVNDGFSGVPLTIVTQSDGTVNTIKGFNTEELMKALGLQVNNPSTDAQDKQVTENSQPATNSSHPSNPSNPPDPSLDQQYSAQSQDLSQITPPPMPPTEGDGQALLQDSGQAMQPVSA